MKSKSAEEVFYAAIVAFIWKATYNPNKFCSPSYKIDPSKRDKQDSHVSILPTD